MERLIKLTLFADIGACLSMLIVVSIKENPETGFYIGLFTFGNILLPTLAAVAIYLFINRWMMPEKTAKSLLLFPILLCIIFILGLIVWAAIDSFLFKTLSRENIIEDYQTQFAGFLPVVFAEALLIPIFDLWVTRKKESAK